MKLCSMILVFIITLGLIACDIENQFLLETVTEYQEKLDSIIDNDQQEIKSNLSYSQKTGTFLSNNSDYNPNSMRSSEDFYAIYENHKDNSNEVQLDEYLMEFKNLLDQVAQKLKELKITEITAYLKVDFQNQLGLDVKVTATSEKEILLKLNITEYDSDYYYGIKLGYEDNNFYVRELILYNESKCYEYFEFLENNYIIILRYRPEQYWYRYVNQNDNTYYNIYTYNDGYESQFNLSWYNPKTMVRTSIIRGNIRENINFFEVFNDKGIIFWYTDFIDKDDIWVAWQLLEAIGWDYAYVTEVDTPFAGIYRNNEKIFNEVRQYNVGLDEVYANVRVELEMKKEEFTDEILNLSVFGMDFQHPELSVQLIKDKINTALEESAHLSVYRGVDFLNDDLSTKLYEVIDDDVKKD